jgi:hypothetical protein
MENKLFKKYQIMKEKVQHLIALQTEVRDEIWHMLNELNKLESTKMSKEDEVTFICSKISLEKEMDLRGVFIHELKSLL